MGDDGLAFLEPWANPKIKICVNQHKSAFPFVVRSLCSPRLNKYTYRQLNSLNKIIHLQSIPDYIIYVLYNHKTNKLGHYVH